MGSTIKITKTKNASYKKLGFLYLVFILFLFFSGSGHYVKHYGQMKVTQGELNERLKTKLLTFKAKDSVERSLYATTLECLSAMDSIQMQYVEFETAKSLNNDYLLQNQFAETKFRRTSLAQKFVQTNEKMELVYNRTTGKSLKSQLFELSSFTLGNVNAVDFFFKETPNGVIESVLEHIKTVYLYTTITELFREKFVMPGYEQLALEEAPFIQKFKKVFVLGNKFELSVKPNDPTDVLEVLINGMPIKAKQDKKGVYQLSFMPKKAGKYTVEVKIGSKRVFSSFEVLRPEFRFVMENSIFDGYVGEPMTISLDNQFIPPGNIRFESDKADVVRNGSHLSIVPHEEGLFSLFMMNGKKQLDEILLYAHDPMSVEVGLLDIAGEKSTLKEANRLESLNTFWQVVSFRMTVVMPSGKKEILKSATRYLRNDLRLAEQNAEAGSVLIFDDIKLISKNRGITKTGRPIVLTK